MTNTQTTTQQNKGLTLHPVISRLFSQRELSNDQILDFLSWDLKKLPNLTNLIDLDKAAERVILAIKNNEKIGVYGDYDVDGTTSCALLFHFFKMLNIEIEMIQPSRFVEGYGIHPPSVEDAINKGIKLLMTVDCGITNNEAAEYALERDIDLIITDHHKDARDEMPKAFAIVNPNRRDEPQDSPLKPMAGVGIAFCLALKIKQILESEGQTIPSLYPLLQFVAVGTVCDLAKLTPVNLRLVRHGLKQLPKTQYPGLQTFISPEEKELPFIPSDKLAFLIGPMINSKGRLDHPEKALKLLTSDNYEEARTYFSHLEICNNERKFIQSQVFKEAKDLILKEISEELNSAIVYKSDWHEGVIGIVASKLVETFNVPAMVFTNGEEEGVIKASCRSAGELNLFEILDENNDLYLKFGGHKAAAGLSMPKENFSEFKKRISKKLSTIAEIERKNQQTYDLEINAQEITPTLLKQLDYLEPFGMGNARPIFKVKNLNLASYQLMKDVHVRWNFKSKEGLNLRGVSFNYLDKWGHDHPDKIFESQSNSINGLTCYFTLTLNHFNGNKYIQLMVNRIDIQDF